MFKSILFTILSIILFSCVSAISGDKALSDRNLEKMPVKAVSNEKKHISSIGELIQTIAQDVLLTHNQLIKEDYKQAHTNLIQSALKNKTPDFMYEAQSEKVVTCASCLIIETLKRAHRPTKDLSNFKILNGKIVPGKDFDETFCHQPLYNSLSTDELNTATSILTSNKEIKWTYIKDSEWVYDKDSEKVFFDLMHKRIARRASKLKSEGRATTNPHEMEMIEKGRKELDIVTHQFQAEKDTYGKSEINHAIGALQHTLKNSKQSS